MSSDKLVRPVLVAVDVPVLDVPVLDVPHREIQTIKLCLPLFPSHAVKFWSWPWLRLLTFVAHFDIRWHRNAPSLSSKHSFFWVYGPGPTILYDLELYLKHLGLNLGEMMWNVSCSFCGEEAKWIQRPQPQPKCNAIDPSRILSTQDNSSANQSSCSAVFCVKNTKNTMWFSFSSMPLDFWRQQSRTVNKGHFARYAVAASCSPHVVLWSPHHFPI